MQYYKGKLSFPFSWENYSKSVPVGFSLGIDDMSPLLKTKSEFAQMQTQMNR
jgi:hypothetical protein